MAKGRGDDPDAALFREAVRDVRPLAGERMAPRVGTGRAPAPRRAARPPDHRDRAAAPALVAPLAPGEPLVFRRAGVRDATLRRLRRGQLRLDAEIDLHGLTGAQATLALAAFLARAHARGAHCVRIVHGKGLRSGERGPVLKATVSAVLRASTFVLACVPAPLHAGGAGAVHVLLHQPRG